MIIFGDLEIGYGYGMRYIYIYIVYRYIYIYVFIRDAQGVPGRFQIRKLASFLLHIL